MAGVSFTDVTKTFDAVTAVDRLSLDVPDRSFMALLGPSGCGKTTVLRMIAGLEEPTVGEVRIGERVVNDVAGKDRDVAMVFQSYALYPHKTARKNIEFPLKAQGVEAKERRRRAEVAAELLGLNGVLDRKPGQMSGGQRQRVALARAIVRRPLVFLMDEPLSNLDAKLRGETRAELSALHRELATTFVYVTHDQVEAMTMGTHVAVMRDGVLQQVGVPQEVYDRPANTFVAQFIGTPPMNLFPPGTLDGGKSIVGVRPEHIRFDGVVPAAVQLVEALGHERHVVCRLDSGETVVARVSADTDVAGVGDRVVLGADPGRQLHFDAATGELLP